MNHRKDNNQEDSRIWFIHGSMLTGDEAESYLKEQNSELIQLRNTFLAALGNIRDLITEYKIDTSETYTAYYNNVLELSEALSISVVILESILSRLNIVISRSNSLNNPTF